MKNPAGKKVSIQSSKKSASNVKLPPQRKVVAKQKSETALLIESLIEQTKALNALLQGAPPQPMAFATGTAPPCNQCCCYGVASGTIMFCEDDGCHGIGPPSVPSYLVCSPNFNNGNPYWEPL